MPDPNQDEILHQLASIRRELRFARWLLLFVSVALAVSLLGPEWTAVFASYVLPVVGAVALVVFAAAVVSRYKPSPAPHPTASAKDPAA